MTDFAIRPEDLQDTLAAALGDRVQKITIALGEVSIHVPAQHYLSAMQTLKNEPGCQFEQLVDLAGVDY
jgi:NADH-quinone oxidoreductase subunit C